jgi:hypothetical protein
MEVKVEFKDAKAKAAFIRAWTLRAGTPVDRIKNGTWFAGANAERALDIANELAGVRVTTT